MPFVEQKPLSVISLATLAERLPEQVIIGIESSKLLSSMKLPAASRRGIPEVSLFNSLQAAGN